MGMSLILCETVTFINRNIFPHYKPYSFIRIDRYSSKYNSSYLLSRCLGFQHYKDLMMVSS